MRIDADAKFRERTIVIEKSDVLSWLRENGIIPPGVPDDLVDIANWTSSCDHEELRELKVHYRFGA
jgi:hypothetical protein